MTDYLKQLNDLNQVFIDYQLEEDSNFNQEYGRITINISPNGQNDLVIYTIGATRDDLINFVNGLRKTYLQFKKPDYDGILS